MKASIPARVALRGLLLGVAAGLVAVPASSQRTGEFEDVTVSSARIMVVGRSKFGGPRQEISISRSVTAGDLDLATAAGMAELERRVKQMSADLCAELDRLYPLEEPMAKDCTRNAVERTMENARVRVATR